MASVLVRNVPEQVLDRLKSRAARHHRSLQQELLTIILAGAGSDEGPSPAEVAAAIRAELSGGGRTFPDSTPLIREDRDR